MITRIKGNGYKRHECEAERAVPCVAEVIARVIGIREGMDTSSNTEMIFGTKCTGIVFSFPCDTFALLLLASLATEFWEACRAIVAKGPPQITSSYRQHRMKG
jgi:hypothetical protein